MQANLAQSISFPITGSDGNPYALDTVPLFTVSRTIGVTPGTTPVNTLSAGTRVGTSHLWSVIFTAAELNANIAIITASGIGVKTESFMFALEQTFTAALGTALTLATETAATQATLATTYTGDIHSILFAFSQISIAVVAGATMFDNLTGDNYAYKVALPGGVIVNTTTGNRWRVTAVVGGDALGIGGTLTTVPILPTTATLAADVANVGVGGTYRILRDVPALAPNSITASVFAPDAVAKIVSAVNDSENTKNVESALGLLGGTKTTIGSVVTETLSRRNNTSVVKVLETAGEVKTLTTTITH